MIMSYSTRRSRQSNRSHFNVKGFGTPPTEDEVIQKLTIPTNKKVMELYGDNLYSKSYTNKKRDSWSIGWDQEIKKYPYEGSKSDLLDTSFSEPLKVRRTNRVISKSEKELHHGVCGRWSVQTFDLGLWIDFSIKVVIPDSTGTRSTISPIHNQRLITNSLGHGTYLQWKELQLKDLPSLRRLINEMKEVIDYPCQSLTCCEKSKNLCERVGLPVRVRGDWTFLIPNG